MALSTLYASLLLVCQIWLIVKQEILDKADGQIDSFSIWVRVPLIENEIAASYHLMRSELFI